MERPKREKKLSAKATESKEYEEDWKNNKRKTPDSVVKKEGPVRGAKARRNARNIKQDPDVVVIDNTLNTTRTHPTIHINGDTTIVLDGVGSNGNPVIIKGERNAPTPPTRPTSQPAIHGTSTPSPKPPTPHIPVITAPPTTTANTPTTTTTTSTPTPAQLKAEVVKQEQTKQNNVKQELQKELDMLKSILPSTGFQSLTNDISGFLGGIRNFIETGAIPNNNTNNNNAINNNNSNNVKLESSIRNSNNNNIKPEPVRSINNTTTHRVVAGRGGGGGYDDGDDEDQDDYDVLISDDEDEVPRVPDGNNADDVIFDLTGDEIRIEVPQNAKRIDPQRISAWTDVPSTASSKNRTSNNNNNADSNNTHNNSANTARALDPGTDEQDLELGENLLGNDGGLLRHDEIPVEGREPPECVVTPLKPHQKKALYWMIEREKKSIRGCRGGMLLDDPGLGKTLSMISLIVTHALNKEHPKTGQLHPAPTLVVAPTHLINVWHSEIEKHTQPNFLNVGIYHGPNRRKNITLESLTRGTSLYHVILTSYGVVKSEFQVVKSNQTLRKKYDWRKDSIFNRIWARIILDEAHVVRNHQAITSRAVMDLHADLTWVVTATPVHNRLNDLYPLFNFLQVYTDFPTWKHQVLGEIKRRPLQAFARLQTLMQQIGIRRPKTIMRLPARDEKRVNVAMSKDEHEFYSALFLYSQERVQQFLRRITNMQRMMRENEGLGLGAIMQARIQRARLCILVLLLRLRQAVCHPQLVIGSMRRLLDVARRVSAGEGEGEGNGDDYFTRVLREAANTLAALTQHSQAGGELSDECSVCFDDTAFVLAQPCGHGYCHRCYHNIKEDREQGVTSCAACRKTIRGFNYLKDLRSNTNNTTRTSTTTSTTTTTSSGNNASSDNNANTTTTTRRRTFLEGLDSDDEGELETTSKKPNSPTAVKEEEIKLEASDIKEEDPLDVQLPPDMIFGASSKLLVLLKMIKEDIAKGDKVIVVSQWTSLLDIINSYLSEQRPIINVNRIDGKTPPMKRHDLVVGFQEDPSIKVCLLSLLAGAEGITLTVSRKLYHVDPWWNPAKTTQASDRVHRIGQERDVEIIHLHSANTIEDSIHELQEKKKQVASAVMGEHKVTEDMTWANEIKLLFQLTNSQGGTETVEINMDDFDTLPQYRRTPNKSSNHPCPPQSRHSQPPHSSQPSSHSSHPLHSSPPAAKPSPPPKSV